jgi:hypothetical protein
MAPAINPVFRSANLIGRTAAFVVANRRYHYARRNSDESAAAGYWADRIDGFASFAYYLFD